MRIALVTEFYYPHVGGVTEHVHNLALQFRRLGHEVTIVTSNMAGHKPDPDYVRRVGKSWVVFSNGSFSRFTSALDLRGNIEEILRERRIEVVHCHSALVPTLGIAAPAAAWRLGIPVVATFHSWFPREPAFRIFNKILQTRMDRLAAKIAVSEPVVWALSRYFRADWEIIPNGVNVGYFHPNGRLPTDAVTRGPRLLFLGRLDPRNGLDTMIAAMPAILERHPSAQLVVAGDGPLRPYYEWRAKRLGRSVRFVGRVYDERPEFYSKADLYVCPTSRASFGITLLESMASGTPMIVSDIIGFRELVNGGREAVLVPVDDAQAWARTTLELVDDPARRAAMGEAGFAKSLAYAWPGVAQRVLRVYERVAR
jgi:phosphatidylinositol alpha-mannosyltransferase